MSNLRLFLLFFLLPLLGGKLIAQSGSTPPQTSHAIVDAYLVAASNPAASSDDVEQAVDGIFSLAGIDPSTPDNLGITDQIVQSQLSYNAGNYPSLAEDNVVTAINNLSTNLALPTYTLTSNEEVRQLHVGLVFAFPQFLLSTTMPQAGDSIVRTDLSPLETTLLFCMLLEQKLGNPIYQMTQQQLQDYKTALHGGQALPALVNHDADLGARHQA